MRSKVIHLPNEILYQDSNDQNQLFPRLQRKDQAKMQIGSQEREQSSLNCLLISLKALNQGLFTGTRPSEKAAVHFKKGQDAADGVLWWAATPQWQFAAIILDSSDYSVCPHAGSLSSERRLYKEGSIQTCLPKKGSSPVKVGAQAPWRQALISRKEPQFPSWTRGVTQIPFCYLYSQVSWIYKTILMWLFATFRAQSRLAVLCFLFDVLSLCGKSISSWLKCASSLWVGRHRMPLTQPQKNVCFGLFCQQWAKAEWKKGGKEEVGHSLLAQLPYFPQKLHDPGQIMLVSPTLLLYKMRGEDMIRLYLQSRGGSHNGIPEVSYKPKSKTVSCVPRSLLTILCIVSLFLTKSYTVGLTSHVPQRKTLRRSLHKLWS